MLETEEKVLRGYGSGAVDFLFKPVNPYILRSKVQIFLDLYTSRRKVERAVEAHEKALKDLEAFNYSVSHDLRAPLRPLDGFSQALLEDYADKLDETGQNYLRRIRAGAQRMGQLIDDLLRLSRIRAADFKAQALDLSDIADAIKRELCQGDPARPVEFMVQPGLMVHGDPGFLRIALENLLRNAWKFTGKKPSARIEFGCQQERGEPVYFVRDDGVGFDTSYASRICQPFQRFHTPSEFEGTGIGLAIVDRIVAHHGGRLWVESAPNRGATFFFTLGPRGPQAARAG
jgi:two-component system sensor histidine kinase/response regulator